MEPGLGDFFSQVPIQFILAPIFFGVLYVILMFFIFRRAAERRRRRKEALEMGVPESQIAKMPAPRNDLRPAAIFQAASAARVPVSLPAAPARPATNTVAALPEPDLDLLTGALLDEAERMGPVPSAGMPAAPQSAPVHTTAARLPSSERSIPLTIQDVPVTANDDPADAVEVMRIWRDMNDGRLIVQMGGTRYYSLADIQNPDLMRRFSAVMRDLNALAGMSVSAAPRSTGAYPVTAPVFGSAAASTTTSTPARPRVFGGRGRRGQPEEAAQPQGIGALIEQFLQARLPAMPDFATRSIHIRPTPDHGIKIEVDGQFFDTIDEVSDPAVRDFLLQVMRDWENRQ